MTSHSLHEIHTSPDGRLRAVFLSVERAAGIWSRSPRIIDRTSGVVLIDLWNSAWDAELAWLADGKLKLDLHRYGLQEWCALVLDPATRTFELFDHNGPISRAPDGSPTTPHRDITRACKMTHIKR